MFRIVVTPNYYQGTCNAPQESYIRFADLPEDHDLYSANDYDPVEVDTEAEAQDIIDEIEPTGTYYLSHGEAGAPSYSIEEDVDVDEDCYDATRILDDTRGDLVITAPEDLPDGIQAKLDGQNVEFSSAGDDYDVWTAHITIDDVEYAIAYCPRTLALQRAGDDLSNLDWDHAAYFAGQED